MIRLIDYIDIILVTYLLYKTYKVLRGTVAMRVFLGILFFVVAWLVVNFVFQMQLLGGIMNQIVNVGAIALIVLFQDEIRQTLSRIGTGRDKVSSFINKIFSANPSQLVDAEVMQIIIACKNMAKRRVGALIVFEKTKDLKNIEVTGDIINAEINARLIENIFYKGAPLHDGAMIISKKRIKAAGCVLPVSHSNDIPKELGLRHRAAMGISEESDAIAIVVSEETGFVTVAVNGEFRLRLSFEDLESFLSQEMADSDE